MLAERTNAPATATRARGDPSDQDDQATPLRDP